MQKTTKVMLSLPPSPLPSSPSTSPSGLKTPCNLESRYGNLLKLRGTRETPILLLLLSGHLSPNPQAIPGWWRWEMPQSEGGEASSLIRGPVMVPLQEVHLSIWTRMWARSR